MTVLTTRDSIEEFSDEDELDEYLGSAEFPEYWDNIDKKRKILSVLTIFQSGNHRFSSLVKTKANFCAEWFFELSAV